MYQACCAHSCFQACLHGSASSQVTATCAVSSPHPRHTQPGSCLSNKKKADNYHFIKKAPPLSSPDPAARLLVYWYIIYFANLRTPRYPLLSQERAFGCPHLQCSERWLQWWLMCPALSSPHGHCCCPLDWEIQVVFKKKGEKEKKKNLLEIIHLTNSDLTRIQ